MLVLGAIGVTGCSSVEQSEGTDATSDEVVRDLLTPIALRTPVLPSAEFERVRAGLLRRNARYDIAANAVINRNLMQLTGVTLPSDVRQVAEVQKKVSADLVAADLTARDAFVRANPAERLPELAIHVFPSFTAFDWRKEGKVTPVRDQGNCGSCWDFAALGAFEGSYLIRNGGSPDASEQQILECSGAGSCGGGFYTGVWTFMEGTAPHGAATEAARPYSAPTVLACDSSLSRPYRVVTWGYVGANPQQPTVAEIKKALTTYGPLATTVLAAGGFFGYSSGVYDEAPPTDAAGNRKFDINHAITLIGWDDAKHAWLIKNSWGNGWGSEAGFGSEKGYMWIDFDAANIGLWTAWVQAQNNRFAIPVRPLIPIIPIRPIPPIRPIIPGRF